MADTYFAETVPLPSTSLSIDDLKQLAEKLQAKAMEAAKLQIGPESFQDADSEMSYSELLDTSRNLFEITIHARVRDEPAITGRGTSVFDRAELHHDLESLEIECRIAFQRALTSGNEPLNWFSLFFDFTKPPVLDWRNPVSNPTPNNSNLTIKGTDHSWVSGVKAEVNKVLNRNRNKRSWLHAPFMYDLGLFAVGLPSVFFALWLISPAVDSLVGGQNTVFLVALYVYFFLIALNVYRVAFFSIRWALPKVEISDQVTIPQKLGRWIIAALSIVGSIITIYSAGPF